MLWTALGGAGIVQRMVSTNHSQNLFPLQSTDNHLRFWCSVLREFKLEILGLLHSLSLLINSRGSQVAVEVENEEVDADLLTLYLQSFCYLWTHSDASSFTCHGHWGLILLDASSEEVLLWLFSQTWWLDWWLIALSCESGHSIYSVIPQKDKWTKRAIFFQL